MDLGYDNETELRLDRMFFIYLRMCIAQEKSNKSNHSFRKSIKIIKNYCSDHTVNMIINEYPIKSLEIKQKTFLILIKQKSAMILYLLSKAGRL